jgi:virginiamycin A acetyltransferase
LKEALKRTLNAAFLLLAFPMALLSLFGRIEEVYRYFAQFCALAPGLPGDYLRFAYYRLTLAECGLESRIQFGSFFAHPQARLGRAVYIGCYCVLGRTTIGDRTQIASQVQILSGKRQHARDEDGRITSSDRGVFEQVGIGAECWIGAGAIVMAEVGSGSTIGAGSVVTKPVPPGSVAVGNPARVIKSSGET